MSDTLSIALSGLIAQQQRIGVHPLPQSLGGNQVHRRFFVFRDTLLAEDLQCILDSEDSQLIAVLVGGGKHTAVLYPFADIRDVIETDDQHLTAAAGRLHG